MERCESWLDRAISSYELAKANVSKLVLYEDLCYQAQQSVEKALKGLLIYYDVEPEFTHNVGVLLTALSDYTDIPDNIKDATKVTKYAVQTRYPGEYDDITKDNYEESLKIAKACLDWVSSKLKCQ
ncbi:MAG: HEPN domain-containing protein [Treponemataceae bacterium]|nr:MAG: HEPN domain-containing protein [Treponemataceae bacterium]